MAIRRTCGPKGDATGEYQAWLEQAMKTAGLVDQLTTIIAPVVLGGGKGLFEGSQQSLDLEHLGVRQSSFASFIDYRVVNR